MKNKLAKLADGDPVIHVSGVMNDYVPIRRRDVVRVLKAVDPSKATGSDKIPLVRQMIVEG